jgi:hypothetical protein
MPLPVVSNSALVYLLWLLGNGAVQAVNVIGAVRGGTPVSQSMANALDTAIKNAFSTAGGYGSLVHPSHSLNAIAVRDTGIANGPMFVGSGGAIPGTGTGDPLPYGNSCVISLKTNLAGPRYRGRIYLPGLTEASNTTAGQILNTSGTAAANFISGVSTAMSGQGLTMAVYSRPSTQKTTVTTWTDANGIEHTKTHVAVARPGAITPIQSINLRNLLWDEQRRRNAGGNTSTFIRSLVAIDVEEQQALPRAASGRR